MANISWTSSSNGNWTTASDWSTGTIPGLSDIAILGTSIAYTVSVPAPVPSVGSIQITDINATLTVSATYGGAASALSIGTLTNDGTFDVTTFADSNPASVRVAVLNNVGSINLSSSSGETRLAVAEAAPVVLTGSFALQGNALLEYNGAGSITSIGAGATLSINGAQAFVAAAGASLNSNSALTGLSNNFGKLQLTGTSVATTGGLYNVDEVDVGATYSSPAASLTIGGTLANYATFNITTFADTNAATVTAGGLQNFGSLGFSGASGQTALQINGSATNYGGIAVDGIASLTATGSFTQYAGSTTILGSLSAASLVLAGGQIEVAGNAPFASQTFTGTLTASSITLTGGVLDGLGTLHGNVIDSGGILLAGEIPNNYSYPNGPYDPNPTLGTLTIAGNLSESGASLVEVVRGTSTNGYGVIDVSGGVTLTGGALQIDAGYGFSFAAGQTFTIVNCTPGGLSGSFASIQDGDFIGIGNSVDIGGGLIIDVVYNDAAGTIQLQVVATPTSGNDFWNGSNANWSTAADWSGGVPGSSTNAVIDGSGGNQVGINAPTSTHSITNATGVLGIDDPWNNGATAPVYAPMVVTVSGNLTNANQMAVDYTGPYSTPGGTSLSIGGTLANGNSLTIGNGGTIAATTVTASSLDNTGSILLDSGSSAQTTLDITGAAGFGILGTVTGSINLYGNDSANGNILLEFGSGKITSIATGGTLDLRGNHAFVADVGQTTSNSALSSLADIDSGGSLNLIDNVTVVTSVNLLNAGAIAVDYAGPYGVIGGSNFQIGGLLTNSGGFTLGGGGGPTKASASSSQGLLNTGTINITGTSSSVQAVFTSSGTVQNYGRVTIGNHGELNATGYAYDQEGGTTQVAGTLAASSINLDGGTLEVESGGSIVGNLAFGDAGATLRLDASGFASTVGGVALGDQLLFAYVAYSSNIQTAWQESGGGTSGTLSLVNGNTTLATVNLSGNYSSTAFEVLNSGGNTLVVDTGVPTGAPPAQWPQADILGSGISDIGWYNPTSGDVGYWSLSNNGTSAQWHDFNQGSTTVRPVGIGDFTGDGVDDFLWQNPSNNLVGDWLMNNGQPTWQLIGQGSTTMNIAGIGDFNGDGTDDILWQNPANGIVGEWQMNNNVPTWQLIGQGSTTMNIAGVGDFAGNGKDDILWENPSNGIVGMWAISGSTPTWSQIGQGSTTMNIVGTGDFTGNGTDDILWENPSNGLVGFWGMNNGQATSWNVVATANTSYQVAGTGDYNGDGTSDILWRNASTGDVGVWIMNNGQASWHDLGISSTSYNVVKP